MLEKIKIAINKEILVDIYLRISVDENPERCILYYPAFLITQIDEEKDLFIGYELKNRDKNLGQRIVTEDSLSLICNVYSQLL